MRTHARAVVIGGGVVGVSTLYHLVKKGWSDSVLVERKELTSGSTWHAAGLLPLFNLSYSVGQIHKYSVALYKRLGEETGLDVGFRQVSNIRLARTQDRLDEYRYYAGVAATIGGIEVKFLTPDEVKEIWPLCNIDGLIGAIQHPEDGYIQPADLTQALARGRARRRRRDQPPHDRRRDRARRRAANGRSSPTRATSSASTSSRRPAISRARPAAWSGSTCPSSRSSINISSPRRIRRSRRASAQGLPEMGVLRESDSSWYMREEAGGLLLGPYEVGAPACYVDGPSADSEYELFQEDLDRLAPHIETAIARVPAFGEVGIKKVYNGAIAYTPDGSPIVGPAPGLQEFLAQRGPFLRRHRGRRRRLAAGGMDRRGRAERRHARRRSAPLRPLCAGGLSHREERGGLRQGLHGALSRRGARRRAAAAPDALLRPHEGDSARCSAPSMAGSGRTGSRRRATASSDADLAKPDVLLNENHPPVGRRRAAAREMELPPLQLFRVRRRRMPQRSRERRPAGHVGVRQIRGVGAAARRRGSTRSSPTRSRRRSGRVTLTYLLTRRGGVRAEFTLTRIGPRALLSRLRRRARERTTTIRCRSCCRPTAACASTR